MNRYHAPSDKHPLPDWDQCGACGGSGYKTVWFDSVEPACRKRLVRCGWCNAEDDRSTDAGTKAPNRETR